MEGVAMKFSRIRSTSLALVLAGVWIPLGGQAEVIFKQSFDDLPEWHSGLEENATWRSPAGLPDRVQYSDIHNIPEGYFAVYQDPSWAPSLGHPDRHESIEILDRNAGKARGGTGKSMVNWRDSYDPGWNRFNSDSLMLVRIGEQEEVYVEFWITLSKEMIESFYENKMGSAKVFRVYSFTGDWEEPFDYFGGVSHPNLIWVLTGGTSYGIRNFVSLYGLDSDGAPEMPTSLIGNGDYTLSYLTNTKGMGFDGEDVYLEDKVNGGLITPDRFDTATIDQVFGGPGSWTKVAFYVRMNSSPGVNDGILAQFVDDKRILYSDRVAWTRSDRERSLWNVVGLGGNDHFNKYPNEEMRENWYAIDDVVIRDSLPNYLSSASETYPPQPPSNISIQ